MDWDNLTGLIGSLAPTIATALGGPLAGAGVRALTGALGLSDAASEKEITAAITNADPETFARIKEAEIAFQTRIKELDVDLEKIAAKDRDSARRRETAVKDKTPAILGILTITAFFAFIGAASFMPSAVIEGRMDFIMLAVGWLGGVATSVYAYYFGSSSGSKQKTELLGAKTSRQSYP